MEARDFSHVSFTGSGTADGAVKVAQTDYGWLLDGPSEEDALVFYPGAKVEEEAYNPLLYRFAEEGMDVCLVKMPFRLAFLGMNKASDVMEQYAYENWYVGGHSLGGAMRTFQSMSVLYRRSRRQAWKQVLTARQAFLSGAAW